MFGVAKKFSPTLHRVNDPKSRKVVKEYLRKRGILVKDNPNKFGVDLISLDGTLQIEVEHRLVWTGDEFPYVDVNVPERKVKFFAEGKVQYIILSKNYTHLGIIDGQTLQPYIIPDNLHESSNKYVRNDEYFYKIPKEEFQWVKI